MGLDSEYSIQNPMDKSIEFDSMDEMTTKEPRYFLGFLHMGRQKGIDYLDSCVYCPHDTAVIHIIIPHLITLF